MSSAGKDTQSSHTEQESSVKNTESESIPTDEKGNVLYERVPVERTIADLFDGSLDDSEVKSFVDVNIKEAEKAYNNIKNKPPKMTTNKQKYLEEKAAWQAKVKTAKEKLDYWNAVEAQRQKITHTTKEELEAKENELSVAAAKEEYRNAMSNSSEIHSADDLARLFVRDAKITPESFREETGLSFEEQRKFVGMISKQGKTIARLAEEVDNQRGDSQSQKQGGAVPISSESEIKNGTLPQSTPTEVDEPQPIGNSFFGKVYNQFKGKAKGAVNFLMRHRSGKLLGVFHRNDIGEISLVWGDEKGGLAHIISKHIVE